MFKLRSGILGRHVGYWASEKIVVLRAEKLDTSYDSLSRCRWRRFGHFYTSCSVFRRSFIMLVSRLTSHSNELASIRHQREAHTLDHHVAVGGRCTGMMMRGCDPLLSVRIGLLLVLWRIGSGRSGRCRACCRIHQRAVLERYAIASATATSGCRKWSPPIVVLVIPTIRRCWVVRMVVLRVMGG